MNWDDVKVFLAVAEQGSFTAAAKRLGITQPTVTRRIDRLESSLRAKLFLRDDYGANLTGAGRRILDCARAADKQMRMIELEATVDQELSGLITLHVTDGFGGFWLPPKLQAFHAQHPAITLKVICTNEAPELSALERLGDIVLTYEPPRFPDVVALTHETMHFRPCASRKYLATHGFPKTLADLADHFLCDHQEYPRDGEWKLWADMITRSKQVTYVTNSAMALGYATLYDAGISMQPIPLGDAEPELVMLDLDGYMPALDFWLVCHRETKDIPRVRVFIDYLKRFFAQTRFDYAAPRLVSGL